MPKWWTWPLELTPHVEERMEERGLTEIDLRMMLVSPSSLVADHVPGRWVARCRRGTERWEVILEPDEDDEVVVVVTTFRVE